MYVLLLTVHLPTGIAILAGFAGARWQCGWLASFGIFDAVNLAVRDEEIARRLEADMAANCGRAGRFRWTNGAIGRPRSAAQSCWAG